MYVFSTWLCSSWEVGTWIRHFNSILLPSPPDAFPSAFFLASYPFSYYLILLFIFWTFHVRETTQCLRLSHLFHLIVLRNIHFLTKFISSGRVVLHCVLIHFLYSYIARHVGHHQDLATVNCAAINMCMHAPL